MDTSSILMINFALFSTGLVAGFGVGFKVAIAKQYKEITKHCDILFEHNKTTWKDPTVHYHGNKIFTNTCSALMGEKCKYTNKKCILL